MIRLLTGLLMVAAFGHLTILACSVGGEHEVTGGTTNRIEIIETFCDEQTYPTQPERKACKDALLEALKCEAGK